MVVGREAITHHLAAKGIAQQFGRRSSGAAQPLQEHGHHRRHQPLLGRLHLHPEPIPLSRGIVAIGITGGGADFIHLAQRLLTGTIKALLHGLPQHCAQALADCCNGAAADLDPQQLIEQRLGLAETQREGAAQQAHQGTKPGAVMARLPIRRQGGAGAGGAAGGTPTGATGAQSPAA